MVAKPDASDRAMRPDGPKRPSLTADLRLITMALVGLVLIAGGATAIWAESRNPAVAAAPHPTDASAINQTRSADGFAEAIRDLQVTQQQAVDQLQIVQDRLNAQESENKKLSEQIASFSEKFDALQANMPAASSVAAVLPSRSHH